MHQIVYGSNCEHNNSIVEQFEKVVWTIVTLLLTQFKQLLEYVKLCFILCVRVICSKI